MNGILRIIKARAEAKAVIERDRIEAVVTQLLEQREAKARKAEMDARDVEAEAALAALRKAAA